MFEMNVASDTSVRNVEEDIESWATQSMPLTRELVSDTQETSSESLLLDPPVRCHTSICYGMVSYASILLTANIPIVCVELLIQNFRFIELPSELRETCQQLRQG